MAKAEHIEVIARGVWIADNHLLVCRNVARGYRFLPGGHVEPGESAAAALAREMIEEADLPVAVGGLLAAVEAVFEQPRRKDPNQTKQHHELNLIFWMSLREADAQLSEGPLPGAIPGGLPGVVSREEKIAFDWVPLNSIIGPSASAELLPHGLAEHLAGALAPPPDDAGSSTPRGGHWGSIIS